MIDHGRHGVDSSAPRPPAGHREIDFLTRRFAGAQFLFAPVDRSLDFALELVRALPNRTPLFWCERRQRPQDLCEAAILAAEQFDLQLREAGGARLTQLYNSPFNGLKLVVRGKL